MKVWLVFQWRGDGMGWPEFQGVFDAEDKALAACKNYLFAVCPATINQELSTETTPWDGAYYPLEAQDA